MAQQMFDTNGRRATYDKPLPELVKELTQEVSTLMRQELDLAKAELSEKGKRAGIGAGFFGGAGLVGIVAFGALTFCFIAALGAVMPVALAALLVAVVYGVIAGVLAMSGKTKIAEAFPPAPEETMESVKEDVRWLRGQRT